MLFPSRPKGWKATSRQCPRRAPRRALCVPEVVSFLRLPGLATLGIPGLAEQRQHGMKAGDAQLVRQLGAHIGVGKGEEGQQGQHTVDRAGAVEQPPLGQSRSAHFCASPSRLMAS